MFDIGWTELLVIAVVLIVVVGPKDLPPMLRAFGKMTGNLRKMAGDFRAQFDDALRESEFDDVRKTISDAKSLNPTNALRDAINPLRQMGQDIRNDLQKATQVPSATEAAKTDVEAQQAVEGINPGEQTAAELPSSIAPLAAVPTSPVQSAPVAPIAAAAAVPVKKPRAPRKSAAVKLVDAEPVAIAPVVVAEKPKRTRSAAKPAVAEVTIAEPAVAKVVSTRKPRATTPKAPKTAKPTEIVAEAAPAARKRAAKKTDATPKDDA